MRLRSASRAAAAIAAAHPERNDDVPVELLLRVPCLDAYALRQPDFAEEIRENSALSI